jgi:type VI secretion system secreted protein Hcp
VDKKLGVAIVVTMIFAALYAVQPFKTPAPTPPEDTPPIPSEPAYGTLIFAEFTGITGEADQKDHEGWIEIDSFSYAMGTPGSGTGAVRRRGDVVIEDMVLVKGVDKTTPKLMEAAAKGTVITTVTIEAGQEYDGDLQIFYRYELENVMVTSYQSTVGATEVPTDTLTLNFEEITVTYTEYDDMGKSKGNVEWSYKIELGE